MIAVFKFLMLCEASPSGGKSRFKVKPFYPIPKKNYSHNILLKQRIYKWLNQLKHSWAAVLFAKPVRGDTVEAHVL